MIITLRRALPILCCLGFLSVSTQAAQTFYKWVDEEGVTHYSAQKPHGQEVEEVAIRGGRQTSKETGSSSNDSPKATSSSSGSNNQTAASQKNSERCDWAKESMSTLTTHNRVRVKDDDGELRYLSEEEKQSKIQEIQKAIDESC